MDDKDVLVHCEDLKKRFCRSLKRSLWYAAQDIFAEFRPGSGQSGPPELRKGEFWAVEKVDFQLKRGECLGIVGHNGAGKTTLLKMLNGLLKPDHGRIEMRGRVGALIALGAGFDPILSGRENIYANGCILGLSKKEIDAKADEIIAFAEVEDAIDSPVRNYSSGMQARLGFAVAAHMDPDILLIDEVLAVGDVSFRNKCLSFIEGIREKGGAYILVTHSFNQVLTSCPKALLMHHGNMVALGDSAGVIEKALELQLEGEESDGDVSDPDFNKPICITGVDVTSLDGGEVINGCPARVEIRIKARKAYTGVSWGFYFWNKENLLRLVSKQSYDSGAVYDIPEGETTFVAETAPITLAPKQYSVRAAVHAGEEASDIIGYEGRPIWFSVRSKGTTVEGVRSYAVDDLVSLDVDWVGKA